jgi:hypothetical protein
MNHEKIITTGKEITDRILLIMNEIPESYKDNLLLRELAEATLKFSSFLCHVADDMHD